VNYFNAVTKTMFGSVSSAAVQQTQSFTRLYMAPGMWHCGATIGAGPGPSSFGGMIQQPAPSFDPQHDLLSALTQWVENAVAPGPVIATKYNNDTPSLGIQMQRPICVFPQVAQYNGTGDPNLPTSFTCAADHPANYLTLGDAHDFNGDGFADILLRDSSGNAAVWLMNAPRSSPQQVSAMSPALGAFSDSATSTAMASPTFSGPTGRAASCWSG